MNYIIFNKGEENLKLKIKKVFKNIEGNWIDNSFYGNYPINFLIINSISENEYNVRLRNELNNLEPIKKCEGTNNTITYNGCEVVSNNGKYIFKVMRNESSDDFALFVIFYLEEYEEDILEFLLKETQKKKEKIKEVKYTKFSEIPQLTRYGNCEYDFSLKNLVDFVEKEIEEQGLNMNPDFQRGHVWTEKQQISFVEFFLRGGKTGRVIYFNNPKWNCSTNGGSYSDYVCVDGLQRYTAIKRFLNNEIKVFGSYYSEYEDTIRDTNTIKVNINDLKSKKEVLQWYLEFNAGGTPHSDTEIQKVKKLLEYEN